MFTGDRNLLLSRQKFHPHSLIIFIQYLF